MKYSEDLVSLLFFTESTCSQQYTVADTGNPDFHRAIVTNRPDYFIKPAASSDPQKKTLILADNNAAFWTALNISTVKTKLAELLDDGFTLYLWQNGSLIHFAHVYDLSWLDYLHIREDMTRHLPGESLDDTVIKAALDQHKVTATKICLLNNQTLGLLCKNTHSFYNPDKILRLTGTDSLVVHEDQILVDPGNGNPPIPVADGLEEIIFDMKKKIWIYPVLRLLEKNITSVQGLTVNCDSCFIKDDSHKKQYQVENQSEEYKRYEKYTEDLLSKLPIKSLMLNFSRRIPLLNGPYFAHQNCVPLFLMSKQIKAYTALYGDIYYSDIENLAELFSKLQWLEICKARNIYNIKEILLLKMPVLRTFICKELNLTFKDHIGNELNFNELQLEYNFESFQLFDCTIDAKALEAILKAAKHCKHLIFVDCEIQGEFSNDFSLPQIESVRIEASLDDTFSKKYADFVDKNSVLERLEQSTQQLRQQLEDFSKASNNFFVTFKQLIVPFMVLVKHIPNLKELSLPIGQNEMLCYSLKDCSNLQVLKFRDIFSIDNAKENILKDCIKKNPNLRVVDLTQWPKIQIDNELQDLLDGIDEVHYPSTYNDNSVKKPISSVISLSISDDKKSIYMTEVDAARNSSAQCIVDANTQQDSTKTFNLTQIFYALDKRADPYVGNYRLSTYDNVDVSPDVDVDINSVFSINNKAPIDLVECTDLYYVNTPILQMDPEIKSGCYYGTQQFNLDNDWQPIASLTPRDMITHYHLSARYGIEIQYSRRDNLYYIRSTAGKQRVTLDFLVKNDPLKSDTLPASRTLRTLIKKYQNKNNPKDKTTDKSLQITTPNPTGETYLRELQEHPFGSCCHLSIALFKEWEEKYHVTHPDVQIRIIDNDCHTYIETKEKNGEWLRVDLGGYPAELNISNTADKEKIQQAIQQDAVQLAEINQEQKEKSPEQILLENHAREQAKKLLETQNNPKNERLQDAPQSSLYFQQLLTGKRSTDQEIKIRQLVKLPVAKIPDAIIALQKTALDTHRPVFYVDSPSDLILSGSNMERGENDRCIFRKKKDTKNGNPAYGGKLYHFLENPKPTFIINYSNFSEAEIVEANSFLDTLPNNVVLIGFMDPTKPNSYEGNDFLSRFDKERIEFCPLTEIPVDPPAIMPRTEEEAALTKNTEKTSINLCHSSHWLTQLMGGIIIRNGEPYFEEGELIRALSLGLPIEILNPPLEDPAFDLFWRHARLYKKIEHQGTTIDFPETQSVFYHDGYDWNEPLSRIVPEIVPEMPEQQSIIHVLNPSLLINFLGSYQFDEKHQLNKCSGILKRATSPLTILITRDLHQDEWGLFFNELEKYPDLTLSFRLAPGVTLPFNVPFSDFTPISVDLENPYDSNTINVTSTDADFMVADIIQETSETLTLPKSWIVLDISECTVTDLLKRFHMERMEEDDPEDPDAFITRLQFTEHEQALLTALQSNKNIILTGDFSHELIDGLAPFLIERSQHNTNNTGKLILINTKSPTFNYLDTIQYDVEPDEKKQVLLQTGQFSEEDLVTLKQEDPTYLEQPFAELVTRLRYQKKNPGKSTKLAWEGFDTLQIKVQLDPFYPATSETDAQVFMDRRCRDFWRALNDDSSYVFLAGLTGVGKSEFIKQKYPHAFHGENPEELFAWANWGINNNHNNNDELRILFIDEANLTPTQWSQFEGLFNKPPTMLITSPYSGKTELIELTPYHKVVFAGNPLSYGDERKMASLFRRHGNNGNRLIFEPLSLAFIYEEIIKPIFFSNLPLDECLKASIPILKVYQFLIENSKSDVLISPRQVQMIAQLTADFYRRYAQNHPIDIEGMAYYYARDMALNLIPEKNLGILAAFHQKFPEQKPNPFTFLNRNPAEDFLKNLQQLPQKNADCKKKFTYTPSRDDALLTLTHVFSIRQYQRDNAATLNTAQRYGGLNRLVLEGASGIGKTEMLLDLFAQLGIHEAKLADGYDPKAEQQPDVFYRLSASMTLEEQKEMLLMAFDRGAIVLIDEINSMTQFEKLLNSLLNGQHPTEKNTYGQLREPYHPGFRIFGTQNPPTSKGRRLASPALVNRTQMIYLSEYSTKDMEMILCDRGLPKEMSRAFVREFKTKKQGVFRDLIKACDTALSAKIPVLDHYRQGRNRVEWKTIKKALKEKNKTNGLTEDEVKALQMMYNHEDNTRYKSASWKMIEPVLKQADNPLSETELPGLIQRFEKIYKMLRHATGKLITCGGFMDSLANHTVYEKENMIIDRIMKKGPDSLYAKAWVLAKNNLSSHDLKETFQQNYKGTFNPLFSFMFSSRCEKIDAVLNEYEPTMIQMS